MTSRHADLAGKVVVVTGGSRALGAGAARSFAANGAHVIVSGRDEEALEETAAAIRWDGGRARAVACDVTRPEALASLREATEAEFGPADVLLAFAGGLGDPPRGELTLEEFRAAVDLNLTGTWLTINTFIPGMVQRGVGSIVTMASSAARQPGRGSVAYAAAKAGIIAMTRQVATDVAPHGVRVNCIAPSAIANERMHARMTAESMTALGASFPLRRIGQPDDIAEAALYLASESAGWVTGIVLDVAGGKVMM